MFRLAIITAICLCASIAQAATVTAAPAGGYWHNGSTWIGGVIPGASDDVVLDSTSGNVIVGAKRRVLNHCRTLDCSDYTGTLRLESMLQVKSSAGATPVRVLTFSSAMTVTYTGNSGVQINLWGDGQRTVYTAGHELPTVTAYAIKLESDFACYALTNAYGLDTDGFSLASETEVTIYNDAVLLHDSQVRCQVWDARQADSVDAGTSTITIAGTHGRPAFIDGAREYHDIVVDSTNFMAMTWDGLPPPPACTIGDQFTEPMLVVNSLSVVGVGDTEIRIRDGASLILVGDAEFPSGLPGAMVSLDSTLAGSPWYVFSTADVSVDYLSLSDSEASGATFTAGPNSIDNGGNFGWGF